MDFYIPAYKGLEYRDGAIYSSLEKFGIGMDLYTPAYLGME